MSPPAVEDPNAAPDPHDAESEAAPSIEELAEQGEVDELLLLARTYRAGSASTPRDLKKCLACYQAAAKLGNAEAEHAVALFFLSGGVVPQDTKLAASLFRAAADKGYLPSKVYVANLYELGISYKIDPDKADVWYRNAARTAGLDVDLPEYAREMAELGCVRFCLALMNDPASSESDRAYFLKKAKAFGWREKNRESMTGREPTPTPPPVAAAVAKAPVLTAPAKASAKESAKESARESTEDDAPEAAPAKKKPKPRAAKPEGTAAAGLSAFVYGSMFIGAALGFGLLAREGVHVLTQKYGVLPVVGAHPEAAVGAVTALLAFLGAMTVYRVSTVARATLVGLVFAAIGHVAWRAPKGAFFVLDASQMVAFGAAGFLAALLVLGLMGGAKAKGR